MEAVRESRLTLALRTPATPWMASLTCRAQLPQFMPVTESSVRRVADCSAALVVVTIPFLHDSFPDVEFPRDADRQLPSHSHIRPLRILNLPRGFRVRWPASALKPSNPGSG